MQSDRLLTLAKRLDRVPVKQFNMTFWGMEWDPEQEEYIDFGDADPAKECGFAGCAVGWACSIPEFRELGLNLVHGTPTYNLHHHFQAAETFFDLSERQAHYLFGTAFYTPRQFRAPRYVASRLREFVREGGAIHPERNTDNIRAAANY